MPSNRWMDKEDLVYVYLIVYTLLSHEEEWNPPICNNMDGPRGYYAKWNKSDRERQILYDFIYMWNVKYNSNEQTYPNRNRVIDTENNQVVARGDGGWGEERNRRGRLRDPNFQLQNKWVKGMQCTVWGI